MASPCRTLLFALALGLSAAAAPVSVAGAAPSQDPGATFGTGETTTTAVVSTTAATASSTSAPSQNNQTLVETEDPPEKAIFTESRKVAAVIGGLVLVALAILLLTIRYIRVTKPVAAPAAEPAVAADRVEPPKVPVDDEDVFVLPDKEPPVEREAADHEAADADWEPRTDEHQRVEIPSAAVPARPSTAARRKALGTSAD